MTHDICLNIHYSAPDEIWDMIGEVYRSMDHWCDNAGYPAWRGENINLSAFVEPGGIQISGEMPDELWDKWCGELKSKLSLKLGYEIGEPEDGFKFKYWTPFEKKYSDIKTIDDVKIVFNDYSTFYWDDFTEHERDITVKRPYHAFRSPLIELYIYFDDTDILSGKKLQQEFLEFQSRLNELNIHICRFKTVDEI
ncbi:hypothetical protein [Ruminococcus albus]|uniref:Uncharacterized protein n=1 Tax=Ruminococcus albus TaxID=1264 RepID=A0A1H7P233_RUMAL|nr:hypothetical protein [Ruminococcus albus]SEL29861.1 hypothetical protein SAMN05216469_11843 [Ruminococcus albus]